MLLIVAGKAGDAIYSLSVAKRFADLRNERVDVLLDAFHFCDEKNEIQDKQFVTGLFALIRSQPYIASCDVLGKTTMATFNGVDRCDLREWFRDYDHRNNVLRDLLESVEYEHEGFSSADPAAPWLLCECVSTESTVVNWTGRYVTQCEQQDEWNANLAILREKVSQNPNPTFLGLES
ncbi:MAG TPA: hypothetical protein VGE52_09355, partial [Pirellulales bacterium]